MFACLKDTRECAQHDVVLPRLLGKRGSIHVYIYIYIFNSCTYMYIYTYKHHHLLQVTFETASVPELRQKLLYTTPSGWWWWCIESILQLSCYCPDAMSLTHCKLCSTTVSSTRVFRVPCFLNRGNLSFSPLM